MNLEPLRDALMAQAEAEARRIEAEADAACQQRLAAARATSQELVEQGRLEGERAAAQEGRRRRAIAGRQGRELRLRAQRSLLDELRRRALASASDLRTSPRYEELLDRLTQTAKAQLGADAELEVDAAKVGGVAAHVGVRYVDYTLPALVERAIDELESGVEALWQ